MTRPGPRMREAMAAAEVGDDVWGDDPTVNRLQEIAAEMFGCEAGLFFPSGSMANACAILTHAQPGTELICEWWSHIYNFEAAGAARLAGVQICPLAAEDGRLTPALVAGSIKPFDDCHVAPTSMVSLENTHNMRGGRVVPIETIRGVGELCRERGLKLHIDGARIFNAHVASGTPLPEYGAAVDSIQFCLSKGLGAPIGSMLVGDAEFIRGAHRNRKLLGGGMRQAGIVAAAGIMALTEHVADLAVDHRRARALAEGLAATPGVRLLHPVETNIILFDIEGPHPGLQTLVKALWERDVWGEQISEQFIRFVTHRDLPEGAVEAGLAVVAEVFARHGVGA